MKKLRSQSLQRTRTRKTQPHGPQIGPQTPRTCPLIRQWPPPIGQSQTQLDRQKEHMQAEPKFYTRFDIPPSAPSDIRKTAGLSRLCEGSLAPPINPTNRHHLFR